jgi:predicted hydrolase (HD superfamily)
MTELNRFKGEGKMGYIPTMEQAYEILREYNKEEFHIRHGETVSGVMRYFAKKYDPEKEEYWAVVGLLHDLDFEMYPEDHCIKQVEIMREIGLDEDLIRAVASHGWGGTKSDVEPVLFMEKILYAVDELTGLIGAVAIMRPSKSVDDLQLKSVKKKYKTPSFAAGCSRETIQKGADMLGWDLDELITETIVAMRSMNPQGGL